MIKFIVSFRRVSFIVVILLLTITYLYADATYLSVYATYLSVDATYLSVDASYLFAGIIFPCADCHLSVVLAVFIMISPISVVFNYYLKAMSYCFSTSQFPIATIH